MLFAEIEIVALVAMVVFLLIFLLLAVVFATFFLTWMRAYLSGAPVMVFDLIGMKLRRTDTKAVVSALIIAKQSDVTIPVAEMEKAWIQGANLEMVTLAMIQATKENLDITFQDLVDAQRDDRLEEMLQRDE